MFKFAVVGEQCSGKTTAAKFIGRHFSFPHFVKFAQPLYEALDVFKMEKNRSFMQKLSSLVKAHTHEMIFNDIFISTVQDLIIDKKDDVLICDDVRFPFELTLIRKLGFFTIGIHADEDIRAERAERLGLEFITDHESETYALDCVKASDHVIRDEGLDVTGLYEEIEKIITNYGVPRLLI
jgi:adenylate kinase family enzyme